MEGLVYIIGQEEGLTLPQIAKVFKHFSVRYHGEMYDPENTFINDVESIRYMCGKVKELYPGI